MRYGPGVLFFPLIIPTTAIVIKPIIHAGVPLLEVESMMSGDANGIGPLANHILFNVTLLSLRFPRVVTIRVAPRFSRCALEWYTQY